MDSANRHFYCFLDFRLSETEGILRRGSETVALGLRAIDTLLVLVRNQDRIVSREELTKAVWPDSVVDDNNLDQQMAALRREIGRDQILTIPRRGYRFLPTVTEEWERLEGDKPAPEPPERRVSQPGNGLYAVAGIVLAATVLMTIGWMVRSRTQGERPAPVQRNRRVMAVTGFRNLSGGAESEWLSTGLTEMLRAELAAGKKIRLISGDEVARATKELAIADAGSLPPAKLAAIRKSLGADMVLGGSYAVLGQGPAAQVRIEIGVQNTGTGETVISMTRSGNEAALFEIVNVIGSALRKELGEGEITASEAQALKSAYPEGIAAERFYAEGVSELRLLNAAAARPLLEKAVGAEPGYAFAYGALAECWRILGYQQKAVEAARKAFALAPPLPRESALVIEGQLRELSSEWVRAIEIYRTLWTFFPDEAEYGLRLANAQTAYGKGKDALATIQELRKLSGVDDPRVDLAEAATAEALGDFRGERLAAEQARGKAEARRARVLAAAALLRESWAGNQMGERKPALEAAEHAKAIYAETGDRAGEARAWKNMADVIDDEGDGTRAKGAYEQALAIFREIGYEAAVATVINNLAYGLVDKGDLNGARKMFEESVAISRKIADRGREAIALNGVANVLWRQGDLKAALHTYESVVEMHRERGDEARLATVLGNVAIVLEDQGQLEEARAKFEESLEIIRKIGDKPGLARTLGNLGELLLKKGDAQEAKKRFQEHMAVAEEMDDNRQRGYALLGLGEALMAEGDLSGARAKYEESLKVRVRMKARGVIAETQLGLAGLSIEEGEFPEAVQHAREAREQFHREQESDQETLAMATEARALLGQGKAAEALRTARPLQEKLPVIQDRAERLAILIEAAPVLAAGGRADIRGLLAAAEGEAEKFGYEALKLEILLAECEINGNRAADVFRLQAVEREARAKGLGFIARKATERLRTVGARK